MQTDWKQLKYLLTAGYNQDTIDSFQNYCNQESFEHENIIDDLEDISESSIIEYLQEVYNWNQQQTKDFFLKARQAFDIDKKPFRTGYGKKDLMIYGWIRQNYADNIPQDIIKLIALLLKSEHFVHWLIEDKFEFSKVFKLWYPSTGYKIYFVQNTTPTILSKKFVIEGIEFHLSIQFIYNENFDNWLTEGPLKILFELLARIDKT